MLGPALKPIQAFSLISFQKCQSPSNLTFAISFNNVFYLLWQTNYPQVIRAFAPQMYCTWPANYLSEKYGSGTNEREFDLIFYFPISHYVCDIHEDLSCSGTSQHVGIQQQFNGMYQKDIKKSFLSWITTHYSMSKSNSAWIIGADIHREFSQIVWVFWAADYLASWPVFILNFLNYIIIRQ